jgi:hypothetical protein
MRTYTKRDLLLARRHAANAAARLESQSQIVRELEDHGHPLEFSRSILRSFEETLAIMRDRLEEIEQHLSDRRN